MAQTARQLREKRGGGSVRPVADLADPGPDNEDDILAWAVGSEPTPEFAAMVAEEYRRLLDRLDDDVLRKVAVLRMEGHTSDEIAEKLGCARRTVARQLALIGDSWPPIPHDSWHTFRVRGHVPSVSGQWLAGGRRARVPTMAAFLFKWVGNSMGSEARTQTR